MQLEAPGTYHHSLVVAQLSENACNAIGANPLLARVCALFHDIGKIVNPGFFTENQRNRANPHDEKDPAASARIIKQHVTDGVELGIRHRLPRAVIDVIRQHHGTTLVRLLLRAGGRGRPAAVRRRPSRGRPRGALPLRRAQAPVQGKRRHFPGRRRRGGLAVAPLGDRRAAGQLIDRVVGERIADGQLNEAPADLRGHRQDQEQLHLHPAQHAARPRRLRRRSKPRPARRKAEN